VSDESYYDLIGVSRGADRGEIRDRYRERVDDLKDQRERLAAAKRPNEAAIGALDDELRDLNRAWQVLADPVQRRRYDEGLPTTEYALPVEAEVVDGDEAPDEPADDETASDLTPVPASPPERRKGRWAQAEAQRQPVYRADGVALEIAPTGRRTMAALIDVAICAAIFFATVNMASSVFNFDKHTKKAEATPAAVELAIGGSPLPAGATPSTSAPSTSETTKPKKKATSTKKNTKKTTTTKISSGEQATTAGTIIGLGVLWFILPTAFFGQTLGKRLTHIMLVDRATGNLPPLGRVVTRYGVALLVAIIFQPVALILGLSFFASRDGLSLLDRLGKTAVVIARYKPARPARF